MSLSAEADAFRKWAARVKGRGGEWETNYPEWERVYDAVRDHLGAANVDEVDLANLTYLLARDNECETILALIADRPPLAIAVAKHAQGSSEAQARWQVAVAIGRTRSAESLALLHQFAADPDEYVRRRAHLELRTRDPAFAENQALEWLSAPSPYARMVALGTLAAVDSPQLLSALHQLRNDDSKVVLDEVQRIEQGRQDV